AHVFETVGESLPTWGSPGLAPPRAARGKTARFISSVALALLGIGLVSLLVWVLWPRVALLGSSTRSPDVTLGFLLAGVLASLAAIVLVLVVAGKLLRKRSPAIEEWRRRKGRKPLEPAMGETEVPAARDVEPWARGFEPMCTLGTRHLFPETRTEAVAKKG